MDIKKLMTYGLTGFATLTFILWLRPSEKISPDPATALNSGSQETETKTIDKSWQIIEKKTPFLDGAATFLPNPPAVKDPSAPVTLFKSSDKTKTETETNEIDTQVVLPPVTMESKPAEKQRPANPLPTNKQINDSIRAKNEERRRLEALLIERNSKAAAIRAEIDVLGQAQFPATSSETKNPANEAPPAEIVEKIRSKEYVIAH